MLDSLSEACESISDTDNAQRFKAEADHLAAEFYGPFETPKPPQDAADVSPPDPASPRETISSPRDPASSRRSFGVQSPSSPPTNDVAAVSETSIREGAASMILRLGLASPGPDNAEDSLSIRQAERDLQETVIKTGGADVIGLTVPSPVNPATGNKNNLSSDNHDNNGSSLSSRPQTSSTTATHSR